MLPRYLPPLAGVARQPYFRESDGELITHPGYDKTAQRFGVFGAWQFVIRDPTLEAARSALDLLEEFNAAPTGEAVVGVRIDFSGVTYGDIFAGYISHDYIDASLKTINGPTLGVDLTWNATELTTLKLAMARRISETTQSSVSGTFDTSFGVSVDHELLRHLILSARAGFEHQDFEGTTREDRYLRFGVGARYFVNRNLEIIFDYDFDRRNSDSAGADYTINAFMLRVVGKL